MGKTNQLLIITEILQKNQGHPTAQEVYKRAKRRLPAISLATVYRVLNKLVKEGKVQKVEINGARFESSPGKHFHFVCENCSRIINIPAGEHLMAIERRMKRKGMTPNREEMVFYGTCKECR